jgi:hypothetical protein
MYFSCRPAALLPFEAALLQFCGVADIDDNTHLDRYALQPAGAGCDAKIEARNKRADGK